MMLEIHTIVRTGIVLEMAVQKRSSSADGMFFVAEENVRDKRKESRQLYISHDQT